MIRRFQQWLDGWPSVILGVLALSGAAFYAGYTYWHLEGEKALILSDLEQSRLESYNLMREIDVREEIIASFQDQIKSIAGTVGTLEKLSQTDEELLKKYSKVYFLNENYVPTKLTVIDEAYLNKSATNIEIHADVAPHLEDLLSEAHREGHQLLVASAFRSFATQSSLKAGYTSVYGSGANKFSADQGYSEHQLGTAVDFTTEKLGANFSLFASDPAYKWLLENAYNYGFILSYPSGNTYYKFEPWHWRYVGVELATKLYEERKNFYDLDQREIDQYLIKLF